MILTNVTTGQVLAEKVTTASSFWQRFRGLMFTDEMEQGFALHISPCQSIHTFFMNYRLDCLYLDERNIIVGLDKRLSPGKIGSVFRGVHSVVELPEGRIEETGTEVGHEMLFSHGIQTETA